MMISYENFDKQLSPKSKTVCYFRCDACGIEYKRAYSSYVKMSSSPCYDVDYCPKCWRKVLNGREEYRATLKMRMRQICSTPEWKKKNSESKKGKINLGESNGMKKEDARLKASSSRKKLMESEEFRKDIGEKTKRAWEQGKFDGVQVGRCKWLLHVKPDGETCRVQGTWEKAFAIWLDENGIAYETHKGRLRYFENTKERFYYPDFKLGENYFIEVKSDYFLRLQSNKLSYVLESNPGVKIELLTKNSLLERGVKL